MMGQDVGNIGIAPHGRGSDNWAHAFWYGHGDDGAHGEHALTIAEAKACCKDAWTERDSGGTRATVATAFRDALPNAAAKAKFDALPTAADRENLADHAAEWHAKGYAW